MQHSPDPLIGRAGELDALDGLVTPGARVTVVGPGGVGKTSLVAAWVGRTPMASHVWCDLTNARSDEDVNLALGAALGADGDLSDLGDGLVVLDGYEQLPVAAVRAVDTRLVDAPRLRVVCTSRRPTGLRGEALFRLPSLSPDDAQALFVDRVRRRQHDWTVPSAERTDLAVLLERLDHLPLAIELAAARRSVMSAGEMVQRLSDRFRLLRPVGGTASAPALWDVLAEAWSGLSEEQQLVLAQCSVFRGGFTLDACVEVVESPVWHVDVLQELVEASVVHATSAVGGTTRFRMSESVRDFAWPFVRDPDALAERHAVWMEARIATSEPTTPGLALERWNVVAAFEHWIAADPVRALRLILTASRLARMDSPQFWLERVERAAALVADPDPELSTHVQVVRARMLFDSGRAEAAHEVATRAAGDAEEWPVLAACALRIRAISSIRLGHADEAMVDLEAALALTQAASLPGQEANAWLAVAGVRRILGDRQGAAEAARSSRALFAALKDSWGEGAAAASMATDEPDPARRWVGHLEAAALSRAGGNAMGAAVALGNLALMSLTAADYDGAVAYAAEGVELAAVWPFTCRWLLALQAGALVGLGRLDAADAVLRRAERLSVDSGASAQLGLWSERAEWHIAKGELDRAAERLEAALALHPHPHLEMRHAQLRAVRGDPVPYAPQRGSPWLEVERATEAFAKGDHRALEERLSGLRLRLAPRAPDSWNEATQTRRSVALLLTLLSADEPKARGLSVGPEGRWYELDGQRVDLSRRGAQRRILVYLSQRHAEAPGEPSDLYDLFEHGWPGERAGHSAVTSRVYNAVQRLRDSGLRHVLERTEDGYRIDPAVEVSVPAP